MRRTNTVKKNDEDTKKGKHSGRHAKTTNEEAPPKRRTSGRKKKGKPPPEDALDDADMTDTLVVGEIEEPRKNPILEKEDLKKLSADMMHIKARVFRYLFTKGYDVNDVHKACEVILWPGLIYQQVYNSHVNWKKLKAKLQQEKAKETK